MAERKAEFILKEVDIKVNSGTHYNRLRYRWSLEARG